MLSCIAFHVDAHKFLLFPGEESIVKTKPNPLLKYIRGKFPRARVGGGGILSSKCVSFQKVIAKKITDYDIIFCKSYDISMSSIKYPPPPAYDLFDQKNEGEVFYFCLGAETAFLRILLIEIFY